MVAMVIRARLNKLLSILNLICGMANYFIILSALALAVSARPQYNYKPPGGISGGITGGGFTGGATGGGFTGGVTGGGFTGGITTGGGYTGGGYTGGGSTVGTSVQHIHRHIYVYGPPEGDEIDSQQQVVGGGQTKKHYKIIFIKAPFYQTNAQAIFNLNKPPEQKTLVYVLVKKPDELEDIEVQTPAPTQPSKPEVYFIKYKTKQQTTGGTTGGGYTGGGQSINTGISTGGLGQGISTGISTNGLGQGISTGIGITTNTGITTNISGGEVRYGAPGFQRKK